MRLVQTLVVRDDVDVAAAQIAFHLHAGVDLVLVADASSDGTSEVLEGFVREGVLERSPVSGEWREAAWRAEAAERAAVELGADWVLDADADEFWLPRGESLKDVLATIPERYSVVQALVRLFLPRPEDARPFAERMSVRRSVYDAQDDGIDSVAQALRPLFRVGRNGVGRADGIGDVQVPLRAWYPIEVLRFPLRGLTQAQRRLAAAPAEAPASWSGLELAALDAHRRGELESWYAAHLVDEHAETRGVAEGSLVADNRLRDALASIARDGAEAERPYAPPSETARIALRAPDIVDDAAYAGECAAVHEVDYEGLERHITDLERRIATLEQRLWPRLVGKLSRAARR
jgi:hypothetical protein